MKIGILTYHRSHNYGAYLQAYSLSHALNKLEGISCEIINYNLKKEDKAYKRRKYKRPIYYFIFSRQDRMFKKVQDKQLLSGSLILDDDYRTIMNSLEEKYDVVIAGSDEIWRIASRGFPNAYWIPGNHKFKKMSYAASGRMSIDELSQEKQLLLKELYSDFDYIGVRDEATKVLVEMLCPNKKIERNCDPAFLYDGFKNKNEVREYVCKKWNLKPEKKLIAIMYDRPNVISNLRKRLGKDYEFVCITRPMWSADKNLCTLTPFEWVDVIGACDYLVSSYFHGMLFALNQNTPFVVIDRRVALDKMSNSKLYDFLSYTDMEKRYYIASEITEKEWDNIAKKISEEIEAKDTDFCEIINEQRKSFASFVNELKSKKANIGYID